jgi:putative sterol carrier protein
MGHPTCCAAALANLAIVEAERLPENAARVGAYLLRRLDELRRFESVGDVRGVGLMAAIELVVDKRTRRGFRLPHSAASLVVDKAWELGLYCRSMGLETVGLAPPLTIDESVVDRMVEILARAIEAMEAELLPDEREVAPAVRVGSTREFFEEVLPQRFDGARAAGLDMVVQIVLDDAETWVLSIRDQKLLVEHPAAPRTDVTCTVRMKREDYLALANGELAGDQAFMTGRLKLEGDVSKAAQLLALRIL